MSDEAMDNGLKKCGQRIAVVGASGSGKTTLTKSIAEHLAIPHIELDALNWEANWTMAEPDVLRSRVTQAIAGDRWVIDGNYSTTRDLVLSRADTVLFLDYPLWFVFGRLLKRTVQRSLYKTELWSGNRENWRLSFFSQDSILLWLLQSHGRYHRNYPKLLSQPQYSHLTVVQLRSPSQTQQWLQQAILSGSSQLTQNYSELR